MVNLRSIFFPAKVKIDTFRQMGDVFGGPAFGQLQAFFFISLIDLQFGCINNDLSFFAQHGNLSVHFAVGIIAPVNRKAAG